MTSGKAVVCGIDLGPASGQVIAYAALFASSSGARVKLLYVLDYLLTPPAYLASYIEEEKKKEEEAMSRWKEMLVRSGIPAESIIMMGRLHESFTSVLGETGVELLVIGYKSHMFRPSSSERLIMSLKAPMLVVRPKAGDDPAIGSVRVNRIICPVDFSGNSGKAVAVARRYAADLPAELTLVHVIPSHLIKEKWMVWSNMDNSDREHFDELMVSEAAAAMASFCSSLGVEKPGEIFHGNPGEVIPSLAAERDSDLIVLGARGLSYLQSMIIGSTTEQVLKSAPCPVLIVH
jgi:nucleotide-binding universal stress UspA family protein